MTTAHTPIIQAFGFAHDAPKDATYGFGLWPVAYDGSIVRAERVHFSRPPEMPAQLVETFNTLRDTNQAAQLVTVRKAGVMEAKDGSHLAHYLIPANTNVQVIGTTI